MSRKMLYLQVFVWKIFSFFLFLFFRFHPHHQWTALCPLDRPCCQWLVVIPELSRNSPLDFVNNISLSVKCYVNWKTVLTPSELFLLVLFLFYDPGTVLNSQPRFHEYRSISLLLLPRMSFLEQHFLFCKCYVNRKTVLISTN